MSYPDNLKYTRDHEWIRLEDDDTAVIGITDFAQSELGDIVFVELEEIGYSFEKEDTFGTVEAVKTVSELFAPVSGEIIDINGKLEEEPELVNDDPYGEGWMIKIKVADTTQLNELLTKEEYEKIIT